jgi:hypothetical protein
MRRDPEVIGGAFIISSGATHTYTGRYSPPFCITNFSYFGHFERNLETFFDIGQRKIELFKADGLIVFVFYEYRPRLFLQKYKLCLDYQTKLKAYSPLDRKTFLFCSS